MSMIAGVSATEYHREYYYKRRARLIAVLGDRCVKCGDTHDLQFDHIDPEQKSFNISANLTASNPKVLEELAKCQLLCADCHREKSAIDNSGWTHGTLYGYQYMKCRCDQCRERKRGSRGSRVARAAYGRPAEHGEVLRYRRGCRCTDCRSANADHARELRRRKKIAAGSVLAPSAR